MAQRKVRSRACLRSSTKRFDRARSKRYTGSTASPVVVCRSAFRYCCACRRTILPQTGERRLLRQAQFSTSRPTRLGSNSPQRSRPRVSQSHHQLKSGTAFSLVRPTNVHGRQQPSSNCGLAACHLAETLSSYCGAPGQRNARIRGASQSRNSPLLTPRHSPSSIRCAAC